MPACSNNVEHNAKTIEEFLEESIVAVLTLYGLCFGVALFSTFIVFCKRGQKQQPRFVILQMIFICGFLVCMGFYFAYLVIAHATAVDSFNQAFFGGFYWLNEVAILGALSIQISDWLFTEQYLLAALNLPIVIYIFDDSNRTSGAEPTEGYGRRRNPEKIAQERQVLA